MKNHPSKIKSTSKFKPNRSRKTGLPPGSLVYAGKKDHKATSINIFQYNEDSFKEIATSEFDDISNIRAQSSDKLWVNINGSHDTKIIESIGSQFNLHPLLLEDILNPHQRAKVDEYENCIYVVARMLFFDTKLNEMDSEQISFVLMPNLIISFQEKEGDVFNSVRERIRSGKGRIRKTEVDYLLYALLDNIVDSYFNILEGIGDLIESIEMDLFESPKEDTVKEIHKLKREMIFLKKSVWPLRDVISNLQRNENKLFSNHTFFYLKDLYDHILHVNENIDIFRDVLTGLQEMYLSNISNRMNMVMKVLTIIATIFIPLTFIVGVYGMNFKFMPELNWPYSYPLVWILMLTIAGFMLYFFRKKNWL